MFKDEYNKQFEDIAPSPALNEETIALMKEAQEHPLQAPAKPQKLRWVLPVCVSSAAAMLALTIGLAFWLKKPDVMEDLKGESDILIGTESTVSGEIGEAESDLLGSNNSAADGSANAGGNATHDADTGNSSNAADSGDASKDVSGNASAPDKNKGTASENQSNNSEKPEDPPAQDDEAVNDAPEEQPESDAPQSTPPADPVDPRAPVEINDKTTETYLSIRAYLDALAAKKTIGYKTNYLAEESLIIVPSWLPTTARFRQLYAYANGGYEYSYLFSYNETEYFLNISVAATLPKTQRDLNLRVKGIESEDRSLKKMQNQWICYYGNYDKATVTVCTLDGKFIPMAETAEMLGNFDLARYTVQNGLVELTY